MHRSRFISVLGALILVSTVGHSLAAEEPKVEIKRAFFGVGKAAVECGAVIREIIKNHTVVTTISTPGLGVKNPKAVWREHLLIEFTVDGKEGTVVLKTHDRVCIYDAILKAAGRRPAAADTKKPPTPEKQPTPATPEKPPTSAPPEPQPASESDITTITLPEKLTSFHLGGGGRFVIGRLSQTRALVIIDVVERKVAKQFDLPSDDARFVAGSDSLLIYQPSQGVVQRYSLQTFERTALGKLALDGPIHHLKMGYASKGPLWAWVPGKQVYAVDVNTFKPMQLGGVKRNGEERHWYDMRVSPDGSTFTTWHGAIGPVGFETTRLEGKALVDLGGHGAYSHGGRWFQPNADGSMILGWSGFLISAEMKPLSCDTLQGAAPMNTADPRYFLALRDGGKGKLRLQIMAAGARQPIVTVDAIERCFPSQEPSVIFLPAEKTLAVVSDKADRIVIQKLDLVEELAKGTGAKLAVVSVPPARIQSGKTLDYQIETLPEKGLTIKLESGPNGMEVSPQGRVTWTAPRAAGQAKESVIISVRDEQKNEVLHAFDIELTGATIIASNPRVPLPQPPVIPNTPDPAPPTTPDPAPEPVQPNVLGTLGAKATPPAPSNGKGYIVIPVNGIIGHHFTDGVLEQCLKQADKEGVNTIVLEIDSLGGLSSELDKITKRLIAWQEKGGRVVALVKSRALSAAAIIAISCKELFMVSASTIGATTEVGVSLEGAIKLKRESATGASDRALAQFTGRDSGLIQAMCDATTELWMKPNGEGEAPTLLVVRPRGGAKSAAPVEGASLLKERNKVLTLTAQEAVALGLAIGVIADSRDIGAKLKIEGWREAKDAAGRSAQAAYNAAEESTKEINRLDGVITKALGAAIGGTMANLVRVQADHKAARAAAIRFQKVIESSPYYSALIDSASLEVAIREIDRRLALLEVHIERERKR